MGTRNLTCVVVGGEMRVAQYGQWSGFPEGVGCTILNFLTDTFDRERFLKGLSKTYEVNQNEIDAKWEECGAEAEDLGVSFEVSKLFSDTYPSLSRDTGGDILSLIQKQADEASSATLPLSINDDFAKDSLMCEWVYVVDLDKNVLEVYKGFNKEPLDPSERFYTDSSDNSGYYPVRCLKKFPLDDLPTQSEFLGKLEKEYS